MLYYYLCAVFTLISATVSFGFSVQAEIRSKSQKGAALINAKYAMARSLSLFLAAIGSLLFVSTPYLTVMAGIMIGVQLFDGIIGVKISTFKTIGPLLTGIGNTIFLVLFLVNAL
ncbi:MAG: hypothetical protein LBK25_06295 [Treponema sp.]|jgi:hypothetical protein|nr:hypothetical protein [Treponema sp.]